MYDGECPFCSRYAALVRLQAAAGPLRLIDARQGGPEFNAALSAGYDLDEGMLLRFENRFYFGADCLNRLALLSTRSDVFNRLCSAIFKSPAISSVAYPVLRFGRNSTLRFLSRKPISGSSR